MSVQVGNPAFNYNLVQIYNPAPIERYFVDDIAEIFTDESGDYFIDEGL